MHDNQTRERGGNAPLPPCDAGQSLAGSKAAASASLLRLGTLLAPVDFSTHSRKALDYVRAFASQFGAEVVLAHVVEPTVIPDNFGIASPAYEEINDSLAKSAGESLSRMIADLPGIRVRTVVCVGRAPWEIVRLARELSVDLIIITTHGYTGLKHVLLGSTAELVVRHAPCPVLTVRNPEHDFVDGSVSARSKI